MDRNGVVRLHHPKTTFRGSAVLVGPRHLLTCEHVVRGVKKDATIWMDQTHAATLLYSDKDADLALLQLAEPLAHTPTPWRVAGRRGDPVTAVGFPETWKKPAPKKVETEITAACPEHTEFDIQHHLDEGNSGGGLFLAQGTAVYLIGLLKCNRKELNSSNAIGAAAIKTFLQTHQIPFPDQDPEPVKIPKKYDESKYLDWLRGYTRKIDFRGLKAGKKEVVEYGMDQLYIPLMTNRQNGTIPLDKAVANNDHIVIQGDAGSGKSTFLRQLAWQCCRPDRNHSKPQFPLLIPIAALDAFIQAQTKQTGYAQDDPRWLPAFLADQSTARKWELDFDYFDAKLTHPETLVLLDGLDEAPNVERRESIVRLFEEARTAYRRCRWVVTIRPRAYEGKATLRDFVTCSILELEPAQIDAFIAQWSLCLKDGDQTAASAHSEDLSAALKKSPPNIARMARNPLMLSALAVVHYNERTLPDQRAELYECILQWLAKSRKDKQDRPRPEIILKYFGFLAFSMQDVKGKYLTRIPKSTAAEKLAETFKLENAADLLEQEDLDSGITASEGNQLKFYHRSYQEFLAARYLAEETSTKRWKFAQPLLLRPEWRETFVLLAGVLYSKGEAVLEEFFEQLLEYGLAQQNLSARARVVGLTGSMLSDLRAVKYELTGEPATAYAALRREVMRIFEPDGAPELDINSRADVADALGQAGDPRLYLPKDPQYWVRVGELEFGRFPVTVQEFEKFVDAGGPQPTTWAEQLETPSRPVVFLDWHAAQAYCRWVTGVRLPTAQEWKAAARGEEGRVYPWGDEPEPDAEHANFGFNVGHTTPVGLFPKGNTPEGLADMGGNVDEWMDRDQEHGGKVLRGGGFYTEASALRGAIRGRYIPDGTGVSMGFRLVRE